MDCTFSAVAKRWLAINVKVDTYGMYSNSSRIVVGSAGPTRPEMLTASARITM